MSVTVYRWDDASAPTLSGAAGALITVLDAVLADGYGSKVAAGWSKAYSGTNKAAYLQGAGSNGFYLRVDDSGTSNSRVVGYEAMTGVDTGTGDFPTSAQVSGGLYLMKSSTTDSTARPWVVVADAKRFFMWVGYNVATSTGLGTSAYMPSYFFGDLITNDSSDAYSTLLIANTSSVVSSGYLADVAGPGSTLGGHYMPRIHAGTGTSIQTGKYADVFTHLAGTIGGGSGFTEYPDPVTNGLLLSPIFVADPTTYHYRGYIPGVWAPLHNLPGTPGDTLSGTLDLSALTFLLVDAAASSTRGRLAIEISDTWE